MDDVIRDEAKNFVFKIISEAKHVEEHEREHVIEEEGDRFPIMELTRDKKFNELLTEIKKEFYEGCKAFNS